MDTERIYCNDTIILDGAKGYCALCRDGVSRKIELFWGNNIPVFCVWKWPDDSARYVCLEPWTGMSNDGVTKENFETRKMERLLPGAEEKYEYKIKLTY
jgi:galactose mutarotase-like enzyme